MGQRGGQSQNRQNFGTVGEVLRTRKNTIYETYLFFSRGQESGESIDKYATVLRNMADNCEFRDLKDSLIRDRIVLEVTDNHVRERLLRVPDLTLEKALEISRAAKATQSQLKQMQNIQEINELRSKNERTPNEKFEGKTPANGVEHIACKFCGRRHLRDRKSRADQKLHYVDNSDQCPFDAVTHNAVENTKSYPKQLFTTERVNNSRDVTFQLDCGATCNLLPLKELSSILEDPTDLYLKKTSATLKMYNGSTVYPLGKCTLRCTRGEVSKDVHFFVVDKNVRPLLGAQTCQELNFIKVMVSDRRCPETVRSVNDYLQTSPSVLSEEWILKMPTPVDKQSLQRLLGMITYLGKFLPHLSDVTEPLRRLLDRDVEWHCDDAHEAALNQVKQLITREPVLRYFDNNKEVTLQCDASESGLGAVIMQEGQPVAFISRALTNTEKNYAQIEKELLSIVHGCIRFDQYVYGWEITVQTDHKPLENILERPLQ